MNKVIVHACGGCGINIAGNVITNVDKLGFVDLKILASDTSDANSKVFSNMKLFKFASTDGLDTIDGSGGVRHLNFKHIKKQIPDYIRKSGTADLHVVIFSFSGGSGSIIGPLIINALLANNCKVIVYGIGDTSTVLYKYNTRNVIRDLDKFAHANNKSLSLTFVNNADFNNGNMELAKTDVDKLLFDNVSLLFAFLSGKINGIDSMDMFNMFDMSQYAYLGVKPGLYGLSIFRGEISLPENSIPVGARSMSSDTNISTDISLKMVHSKAGVTTDADVCTLIKTTPIHAVSHIGYYSELVKEMDDDTSTSLDALKAKDNTEITVTENSDVSLDVDDDLGMSF